MDFKPTCKDEIEPILIKKKIIGGTLEQTIWECKTEHQTEKWEYPCIGTFEIMHTMEHPKYEFNGEIVKREGSLYKVNCRQYVQNHKIILQEEQAREFKQVFHISLSVSVIVILMYVFHRLGVKRTLNKLLRFITFHWLLTIIIRFRYYKTP